MECNFDFRRILTYNVPLIVSFPMISSLSPPNRISGASISMKAFRITQEGTTVDISTVVHSITEIGTTGIYKLLINSNAADFSLHILDESIILDFLAPNADPQCIIVRNTRIWMDCVNTLNNSIADNQGVMLQIHNDLNLKLSAINLEVDTVEESLTNTINRLEALSIAVEDTNLRVQQVAGDTQTTLSRIGPPVGNETVFLRLEEIRTEVDTVEELIPPVMAAIENIDLEVDTVEESLTNTINRLEALSIAVEDTNLRVQQVAGDTQATLSRIGTPLANDSVYARVSLLQTQNQNQFESVTASIGTTQNIITNNILSVHGHLDTSIGSPVNMGSGATVAGNAQDIKSAIGLIAGGGVAADVNVVALNGTPLSQRPSLHLGAFSIRNSAPDGNALILESQRAPIHIITDLGPGIKFTNNSDGADIDAKELRALLAQYSLLQQHMSLQDELLNIIVDKLPARNISDFSLSDTVDGVEVGHILRLVMALVNADMDQSPATEAGWIRYTVYNRSLGSVLTVFEINESLGQKRRIQ